MLKLGHQLAALVAGIERQLDLALPLAARRTVTTQLLKAQHTAFVARTPGFDALPDPHFFLCQHLVELGVGNRLVVQHRLLAQQIFAETAGARHQLAAIKLDDACCHAIKETPVVGNEQQRRSRRDQQLFQPLDGSNIKVVGRLIKQQQLGRNSQGLRQRETLLLPAGEAAYARIGVK